MTSFTVDLPEDIESIRVVSSEGRTYYQSESISKGILKINTYDFPNGVYYLTIETKNGIASKRLIKF